MKRIRLVLIAGTVALLTTAAFCGDEDVRDTTTSSSTQTTTTTAATTTTTQAPRTTTTTKEPTTTTTTTPRCLAEPIVEGRRTDTGTVVKRYNSYAEVDCAEVFGGESIQLQAVLATDTKGRFEFDLDKGVDSCLLLALTNVQVRPDDVVVLRVNDGEMTCTFEMGEVDQTVLAGDEVVIIDGQHQTTAMFSLSSGDTPTMTSSVAVTDGFVAIEPSGLECRRIVGPDQVAELSAGRAPVIRPMDVAVFSTDWTAAFEAVGGSVNRPDVGPELLPGLRAFIDANDITVLVDDVLIDTATELGEASFSILERITGSQLAVDGLGQFSVIKSIELEEFPVFIVENPLSTLGALELAPPLVVRR